jgi:cysteinyl-tRNA synthetase
VIRIHDTLTRSLRDVTPGPSGAVLFYSCGPTVHDHAHVGNFRTYVWVDQFKRLLKARGVSVRHVMNITDVDDRIIEKAQAAGIDVTDPGRIREYTDRYESGFHADLATLRIQPADEYPHATGMVPQMLDVVRRLIDRGHAYVSQGSVYFRIGTFPTYGDLAHLEAASVKDGARVDTDKYEKEEARDFVLWKAWRPGEPRWESPWGPGRPGWHLECSAMAMSCLGAETIDVHAGGEDLVFPHHTNEIAQSEGATGVPFCRIWMHGAHLRIDAQKMSKSLGNFFTLGDLVAQGLDPVAVRYLLGSVHYRAPLNLMPEALDAAGQAVARLNECARLLASTPPRAGVDDTALVASLARARRDMDEALDDDLNTAEALGALFVAVREANAALAAGGLGPAGHAAATELLRAADGVFAFLPTEGIAIRTLTREIGGKPYEVTGVGDVPEAVLAQVAARQEARRAKDFATADRLRDELAKAGYVVEDVTGGARVKRA